MSAADPFLLAPAHTNGVNGTNGAHADGALDAPAPSAFDAAPLRAYLLALLPPLLGAHPDDVEQIFEDEFEERAARFAAEGNGVVYVSKLKHEIDGAAFDLQVPFPVL